MLIAPPERRRSENSAAQLCIQEHTAQGWTGGLQAWAATGPPAPRWGDKADDTYVEVGMVNTRVDNTRCGPNCTALPVTDWPTQCHAGVPGGPVLVPVLRGA